MRANDDVTLKSLKFEMYSLLHAIDFIFQVDTGQDAFISAATNGLHDQGSKHYQGLAVDFDTSGLSDVEIDRVARHILICLPYLVIVRVEDCHIHVEYNPMVGAQSCLMG